MASCSRCGSGECVGLQVPARADSYDLCGFQFGGTTFTLAKSRRISPGERAEINACELLPAERERFEKVIGETMPLAKLPKRI